MPVPFATSFLRLHRLQCLLLQAPLDSSSSRPSRDTDSDIGAMIEELLPASFLRQSVCLLLLHHVP